MSWEFDGGALIAGVIGLISGGTAFGAMRARLAAAESKQAADAKKQDEDHKALEARVEKVELLAQAVTTLGQTLPQSIKHQGELFAAALTHLTERQADHNAAITKQLTEIREEQRSFGSERRPAARRKTS